MTIRVKKMTPVEHAAHLYKRRLREARYWERMTPEEREAALERKRAKDRARYARDPEKYKEKDRLRRLVDKQERETNPVYREYYREKRRAANARRNRNG